MTRVLVPIVPLVPHVPHAPHPESAPSPDPRMPSFALAKVLRIAGAGLVMAAAATFLLQRWSLGNDVHRYLLLLGQTVLLVVAAFVCGVRIQETRGSRTFFALVVASLPIHFAVLGGLVHSRFALDVLPLSAPSQAIWIAPSKAAAAGTVLGALAVLVPVTLMALVALARSEASRFLGLLLASNALLLVPVRHPSAVALGFAFATCALLAFELTVARTRVALRTPEGCILRALLWAPPLLAVGRAAALYDPNAFFCGTVGLTAGITTFAAASRLATHPRTARLVRFLGALTASLGWLAMAFDLGRTFDVSGAAHLPLSALPLAALLVAFGTHAGTSGPRYRATAAFVALGATAVNVALHTSAVTALLLLVVGLVQLAAGVYRRRLPDILVGALASLSGLGITLYEALGTRFLGWGSLTLVGITLLFIAAGIERHPERFSRWVAGWSRRETDVNGTEGR